MYLFLSTIFLELNLLKSVFANESLPELNNVVSANNENDLFRYFLFKGKILS